MRKVQFRYAKNGTRVNYPDDINLFKNVEIDFENLIIYAEYYGSLDENAIANDLRTEKVKGAKITKVELLDRFGPDLEDKLDSMATVGTDDADPVIRRLWRRIMIAEYLETNDPRLVAGVSYINSHADAELATLVSAQVPNSGGLTRYQYIMQNRLLDNEKGYWRGQEYSTLF